MKTKKSHLAYASLAASFLLAQGFAQAAISYVSFNNGSNADISSENIYTHKLDFGGDGAATINGVIFDQLNKPAEDEEDLTSVSTSNFTFTVTLPTPTADPNQPKVGAAGGGATSGLTGALGDMMNDMIYAQYNGGTVVTTMTLTGLMAGTTYDLRIYTQQWGGGERNATFTFSGGGSSQTSDVLNQNDARTANEEWVNTSDPLADSSQPYYINYQYTAGEDGTATVVINQTSTNATWHVYGLTNQVVIPEPSAALLVLGGLGMISLRRKRA